MTPLLILTACLGYIFLICTYRFKYSIQRSQNWHLFFMSMSVGAGFLFISFWLNELICLELCVYVDPLKYQMGIGCLALLLAVIVTKSCNYFIGEVEGYILSIDNDLDGILFDSLSTEYPIPLQFTLQNKKVYVGIVAEGVDPPKNNAAYISILPVSSGYRDSESLELNLVHDYRSYWNSEESLMDLTTVIPKDKIVSCNYFNDDIYAEFSAKKAEAQGSERTTKKQSFFSIFRRNNGH